MAIKGKKSVPLEKLDPLPYLKYRINSQPLSNTLKTTKLILKSKVFSNPFLFSFYVFKYINNSDYNQLNWKDE